MANNTVPVPNLENDEITLRELIQSVRRWVLDLRQNWKTVLLCVVPLAGFFVWKAYATPFIYPANLTFMVREEGRGGFGGLSGLLGQFGLGGQAGEYNLDKISELGRSRLIVQAALLQRADLGGQNDFLANHIIREYGLHSNDWRKDPVLHDFFFTRDSVAAFGRAENKALQALHGYILFGKEKFVSLSFTKQTGILALNVAATSEDLSVRLADALYEQLSRYYIEQSTAQPRQTVRNLQERADSIRAILTGSERQLAREEDSSFGLLLKTDRVPQKRLGSDIAMLNLMYAEAIKNLETASFFLKNATPFFVEIDRPVLPVKPIGKSKVKAAGLGVVLGFLLSVIIIFTQNILRKDSEEFRHEKD